MAHDGAFNGLQVTEAVYADGVLTPVDQLELNEHERVKLVVTRLTSPSEETRQAAIKRLFARIDAMGFRSSGPYPSRDELHERR